MISEKVLKWLESEKKKDNVDVSLEKQKFIRDIKNLSKKDLFPEPKQPKKYSLWKKIKIMIWGHSEN